MTTEPLPFDGGDNPDIDDAPQIGDRVYVKDKLNGVGEILRIKHALGITAYVVAWRDSDGVIIDYDVALQEFLTFVSRPTESETTE